MTYDTYDRLARATITISAALAAGLAALNAWQGEWRTTVAWACATIGWLTARLANQTAANWRRHATRDALTVHLVIERDEDEQ